MMIAIVAAFLMLECPSRNFGDENFLKKIKLPMMKKTILALIVFIFLVEISFAQSRAYTAKGGLTVGVQQWEGVERDPLWSYHGALSMESTPEYGVGGAFAQLGYHVKGSAWRNTRFTSPTGGITFSSERFEYQNLSLLLGFKKGFSELNLGTAYYLFGIRGEYTLGTNLDEYEDFNNLSGQPIYPFEEAVRRWNYGITVGTGL
ncbi:MAG: hypothetical protein AAF573_16065, partial [Bacteroidota bacterium]